MWNRKLAPDLAAAKRHDMTRSTLLINTSGHCTVTGATCLWMSSACSKTTGLSVGLCMQLGWSVEGLERIQRHAEELLPRLFPLQADCYEAASPSTLQPVSPYQ